jgi:hypothetical protein
VAARGCGNLYRRELPRRLARAFGCRFAAKIGQVLEESVESLFWLELCDARAIGLGTYVRI